MFNNLFSSLTSFEQNIQLFQQYPHLLYIPLILFGLIFGSFANVIIYRMPKGENIVLPPSHCFKCSHRLAWYDNIPLISFLLLRGRCRYCKEKFSPRYALVEFLMALTFFLAFYFVGFKWVLLEYLILFFGLVTVSFIDIDHFILPDEFTLSGIFIGLLGAYLNPSRTLLDSFLGVLLGGGFLWAIAHIYFILKKQEGMGGGDVKLLAWIGAVVGWKAIPFIILTASVVGSFIGVFIIIKEKKDLKTVIPFGPYLALGAALYIYGGESLAQMYIKFFFPGFE